MGRRRPVLDIGYKGLGNSKVIPKAAQMLVPLATYHTSQAACQHVTCRTPNPKRSSEENGERKNIHDKGDSHHSTRRCHGDVGHRPATEAIGKAIRFILGRHRGTGQLNHTSRAGRMQWLGLRERHISFPGGRTFLHHQRQSVRSLSSSDITPSLCHGVSKHTWMGWVRVGMASRPR